MLSDTRRRPRHPTASIRVILQSRVALRQMILALKYTTTSTSLCVGGAIHGFQRCPGPWVENHSRWQFNLSLNKKPPSAAPSLVLNGPAWYGGLWSPTTRGVSGLFRIVVCDSANSEQTNRKLAVKFQKAVLRTPYSLRRAQFITLALSIIHFGPVWQALRQRCFVKMRGFYVRMEHQMLMLSLLARVGFVSVQLNFEDMSYSVQLSTYPDLRHPPFPDSRPPADHPQSIP